MGTRLGTCNHELERPLPKGKNEKVIGLMKGELGGKIMTEFIGLRVKIFSNLTDDGSENKKAEDPKSFVIKRNASIWRL